MHLWMTKIESNVAVETTLPHVVDIPEIRGDGSVNTCSALYAGSITENQDVVSSAFVWAFASRSDIEHAQRAFESNNEGLSWERYLAEYLDDLRAAREARTEAEEDVDPAQFRRGFGL